MGRVPEAIEELKTELSMNPDDADARDELAELENSQGKAAVKH